MKASVQAAINDPINDDNEVFMGNYVKLFIAILSFIISANALAAKQPAAEKAIQVLSDKPEFTITVAANPTTGYRWFLKQYPADFISVVASKYQAPASKLVGAGGNMTFTFKVNPQAFNVPHIFRITLWYAQAWNLKDATKKTFYVVTEANNS